MLKSVKVRDHMLKKPVLVHPDTDIFEAMHLILVNKISGVTVVDNRHRPVGILSELDCLGAILSPSYHQEEIGVHKVESYMSSPVESVFADENIIEVAQSMLDHKRRRRPVVDSEGILIGQLTCRQLLRAIKEMDTPPDRKER
jgi:CBS domain-containing protein